MLDKFNRMTKTRLAESTHFYLVSRKNSIRSEIDDIIYADPDLHNVIMNIIHGRIYGWNSYMAPLTSNYRTWLFQTLTTKIGDHHF